MKKGIISVFIYLLMVSPVASQLSENYTDLKNYIQTQQGLNLDSSEFLSIYHNKELHYLQPLYKAFSQEKMLISQIGTSQYYADLAQAVAFNGDYASVLALQKTSNNTLPDSIKKDLLAHQNLLDGVDFKDAKTYVLERARNQQVLMVNELHDKPQHRVLSASLLENLYAQGFRYLAMETFNPYQNGSLKHLNMLTGHFTCEPLAGELVRLALNLGYTLVAYEDTVMQHTPNQRSYGQANNIYSVIQQDAKAKILVLTSDGAIEEGARSDDRIPMAAYFKIISGIDPLTINQTEMTEGSNNAYTAFLYEIYAKKNSSTNSVVALKNNKSIHLTDENLSDIYLMHPPTKFKNGRAVWYNMNGLRTETAIQPIYQSLFFVQAFYDKEYNQKLVEKLVPADQSYITAPDGYYYLFLQKGRYQIVFRDKQYKILGTKVLMVL